MRLLLTPTLQTSSNKGTQRAGHGRVKGGTAAQRRWLRIDWDFGEFWQSWARAGEYAQRTLDVWQLRFYGPAADH